MQILDANEDDRQEFQMPHDEEDTLEEDQLPDV